MTHRSFTASLVTLSLVLLSFPAPSSAQQPTQHCPAALSVKKDLEQKYQVKVTYFDRKDISNEYPDHPTSRTEAYSFGMQESPALQNLLRSSKLLAAMSKSVIQGCNSVGLVGFGEAYSDGGRSFGLFSDGRIGEFACAGRDTRSRWGQKDCY